MSRTEALKLYLRFCHGIKLSILRVSIVIIAVDHVHVALTVFQIVH